MSKYKRTRVKFYVLIDPRTNFVFYLGWDKSPDLSRHIRSCFSLRTRIDQYIFSCLLDRVDIDLFHLGDGFVDESERWMRKFPKVLNNLPAEPRTIGTEKAIRERFVRELGNDGVDKLLLSMGY